MSDPREVILHRVLSARHQHDLEVLEDDAASQALCWRPNGTAENVCVNHFGHNGKCGWETKSSREDLRHLVQAARNHASQSSEHEGVAASLLLRLAGALEELLEDE